MSQDKKDNIKLTPVDSVPLPGQRDSTYLPILQAFIDSDLSIVKVEIDTTNSVVPAWKMQDAYAKLKYQVMKNNLPVKVWFRKGDVYIEKERI